MSTATRSFATSATRSRPVSASRADRDVRTPTDLERSVARFIAHPRELFSPSTPVRQWQFIVLHHSGAGTGGLASIDRFHREANGWDECGYHFVIGNGTESGDGEIEVGSRWSKQKHGAHTKPGNNEEYNQYGIGICLVGNFNDRPPSPKQLEVCRRLVAYLQQRCGVPPSGVITHGDVAGTHTECPGRYFPHQQINVSTRSP